MSDATVVMGRSVLPIGHELLWYTIEEVLGNGGFGTTYLATDNNLNRKVAIKEYLPSVFAYRESDFTVNPLTAHDENYSWGLTSFLNEAKTLAQFKHRNVVQVHTVFEAHKTAYMVMEYEQGDSLEQVFKANVTTPDQAFFENLLFLVMDGLQSIHDAGFIHRDIKPGNLYIRTDGSPVLIDFGSARATSQQESSEMTTLVSQGYTPLEQYSASYGEQGPWTDIYSLASCVYRGITGTRPSDALSRSAAKLSSSEDPLRMLSSLQPSGFDNSFCHAIDQALSLEANLRPQCLADWRKIFDQPVYSNETEDDQTRIWQAPQDRTENTTNFQETDPEWVDWHDDSANSRPDVIDNSRSSGNQKASSLPLIGGALFLAAALAGGGWLLSQQQPDSDDPLVSVQLLDQLPKPTEPIDIAFPDDEVESEIADLRDLTEVYQALLKADPSSVEASEGMKYIVKSYKLLSELTIIKANASLRKNLGDALARATPDADSAVETLINKHRSYEDYSTFAHIEPLLDTNPSNAAEREQLIFGLASLPSAEMQTAIKDSRVIALLGQFKRSIVATIEISEFDRAAHMLALALSVSPEDSELVLLANHLTQRGDS